MVTQGQLSAQDMTHSNHCLAVAQHAPATTPTPVVCKGHAPPTSAGPLTCQPRAEGVVRGAAVSVGALDLGTHALAAQAAGQVPSVLWDGLDIHRLLPLHVQYSDLQNQGRKNERERRSR